MKTAKGRIVYWDALTGLHRARILDVFKRDGRAYCWIKILDDSGPYKAEERQDVPAHHLSFAFQIKRRKYSTTISGNIIPYL